MITSLKIGPIDFSVQRVVGLRSDQGELLDGQIDLSAGIIQVDAALSPGSERQTLWHEVSHAILEQAGLPHDETIIQTIASGVQQVLQDNPELGMEAPNLQMNELIRRAAGVTV